MNTPLPSPQDELEMRVTALLLGQLSAEEASALRQEMQKIPELQKLHDRLQQTIGLVREARESSDEADTAPAERLTLSADRRARLLASFKTIRPMELAQQQQRRVQRRELMLVAAMLAGLMGVASVMVTLNQPKARAHAQRARPELLAIRPEQMVEEEFAMPASPKPAQPESDEKPASGTTRNWFFGGEAAGKSAAMEVDKLHVFVDRPTDPATATPKVRFWDTTTGEAVGSGDSYALGVPTSGTRVAGRGEVSSIDGRIEKDGDAVVYAGVATGGSRGAMPATDRFGNVGTGVKEPQSALDFSGRADKSEILHKELAQVAATTTTPAAPSPVQLPTLGRLFNQSGQKALDDSAFTEAAVEKKAAAEPSDARGYRFQIAATPAPGAPPPPPPAEVAVQAAPSRNVRARVLSTAESSEGLVRQLAEQPPVAGPVAVGQDQKLLSALAPASKPAENQALARFENSLAEQNSPATTTLEHLDTAPRPEAKTESRAIADFGTVANRSLNFDVNRSVAENNYFAYAVTPSTGLPVDQLSREKLSTNSYSDTSSFSVATGLIGLGFQNSLGGAQAGTRLAEARFDNQSDAEDFITRDPQQIRLLDTKAEAGATKAPSLWGRFRNALTRQEAQSAKEDLVNEAIANGANLDGRRAKTDQLKSVSLTDATVAGALGDIEAKTTAVQGELRVTGDRLRMQSRSQENQQLAARGEVLRREKLQQVETAWREQKQSESAPVRRPAPNAATPQPEVITAENAFSTFSLNVSDVSFKLAAASLDKNQMPDAASVRTEEFINAFDYRDPEPTGNRPLAFNWERARYPFAHNRDLLRFSVKTAASGRQPGRPLNLVLLLDNSGSMERSDRIRIRQECLRVLATQLQPSDRVSVVAFARTPRLWVDGLPGSQAGELAGRVGQLTPDGGTNLEEAMNLAYQTARRYFQASGINRVVLLTDGAANLGDVEPDSLRRQVEVNRQQGVALDCFGIGWDGYNDDLLEALSRNGDGRYGFINTPEAATTEFAGQLAGALRVAASDVKVQVQFNPRRVTAHRQMGYAKHQLTKEQFRDNTVDAAEIGAAEAGNALYVVEVNPAGEGPLGVARVRFKVPGTSDYREQEWTLAYDGAAKGLAQAAPSLRLAGVAAAFSEWLVASPFAAEVTPSGLQGYLTGVSAAFGTDARPKQLETMLRQAGSLAGK